MDLNYDQFNGDALIFKYNLDEYGNPISIKVDKEEKQVSVHGTIQLEYVPDEYNRVVILNEDNTQMTEVFNRDEIKPNTYYVDYNNGVVYLDKSQFGKTKIYNYYKKGLQLIGCSRIYDEHDVSGKHVVLTLQEIIDAGREALRFLLDIGDAKKVIELLESLIAEGKLTITNLENKKNECIQSINNAISQATQDKNEIVQEIQDNIQQAKDEVVNVAGNKEVIIKSSQWALNGDVYEKEITHDLNSENLHVTAKNSDTKEAVTIGYKILDKTRILLKSDEAINMSVILSASYYHAAQTISDNIAEEVVKARKGELDLKTKIDSIDNGIVKVNEQLDKNTKQLVPNFYDGAIVTFIDDDCYSSVNKWVEIANEKGIKLSFAMVKDWVGTAGYCNLDAIQSLQNNGHDILNHTKSHINNWDITNSEIIKEIEENIDYMKANGLNGYDVLVYPGTVPNESRYKTVTREKCRYGIANTYQSTNKVQDSFYMNRIDSDYRSLDQLKSIVDQAIIDKQWVLIMTHSWRADGDVNSTGTFSIEKIKQLIDYIKGKNIPILKFTEAEKYKGNSVSIGDYNNGVYIGKDGKNNLNYNNVINGSSITKLAIEYNYDEITIETIRTYDDNIFNKGGILITFRSSQANFTYQLYFLWDSNIVYKRRWKEYEKVWDDFERIDAVGIREKLETINDALKINNNNDNTLLMDAPITDYEVDKETIVIIRTPLDTFKGSGGTMKVFRSSQANFSYATYVPWNESAMYIRHWAENSQWGSDIPKWTQWVKMGS